MSIHINAKQGEIADKLLLPGDPLRAKYIAETYLENPVCYNEVRGMYGYTGTYKGERLSVQGTGMGAPSAAIYINELINDYGVKKLIRVGTCGALNTEVKIRDIVVSQAAVTTSSMVKQDFPTFDFPQIAKFKMLSEVNEVIKEQGLIGKTHFGNVLSDDLFYRDNTEDYIRLAKHGVLAVEMEIIALYYLASKFNVDALAILTVSDHLITDEHTTSEERQESFNEMLQVGLDTLLK